MLDTIGKRIKWRRTQMGLTQQDLADALFTTQTQIWRYESDKHSPSADVLVAIAKLLEVSTDWLLGATENPSNLHSIDELRPDEQTLLEVYRAMSDDRKKMMLGVVGAMAN